MAEEPDAEKGMAAQGSTGTEAYMSRFQSTKEWIAQRRETVRPWGEFISNKASRPKNVATGIVRLKTNLIRFQSNYLFVCLALAVYCVITSPLLLIALAISAVAHHYIGIRLATQPIRILGRDFTASDHAMLSAIIALPLLFLSSAGSASLWIVGASVVLISLHALAMPTEDESTGFDLEMDDAV